MLPWDDVQKEWRGYQIAVTALVSTYPHHREVFDTNFELTGISHQIFASEGHNTGYAATVRLLQTIPLTRLELNLNTSAAEETNFSCFHNSLLKTALSHATSLRHLALSISIDTADDDSALESEEAYVSLDKILPIQVLTAKLQRLKLCNFLIHGKYLLSALSNIMFLSAIRLDCVALSDDLMWRQHWLRAKDNLVGNWDEDLLGITFRRKATSLGLRLDSSAELAASLYGEGTCPFVEKYPQVTNVGWIVSNWDPG